MKIKSDSCVSSYTHVCDCVSLSERSHHNISYKCIAAAPPWLPVTATVMHTIEIMAIFYLLRICRIVIRSSTSAQPLQGTKGSRGLYYEQLFWRWPIKGIRFLEKNTWEKFLKWTGDEIQPRDNFHGRFQEEKVPRTWNSLSPKSSNSEWRNQAGFRAWELSDGEKEGGEGRKEEERGISHSPSTR